LREVSVNAAPSRHPNAIETPRRLPRATTRRSCEAITFPANGVVRMAGIEAKGIAKRFGDVRALKGVSLSVAPGEFVSLVGPSGCGKTTLMRIVAGLERPDEGSVAIAGHDVTDVRAAERDVAMVFQSYALYPHLTARQNMAVPLVMRRLDFWRRLPWIGDILPRTRAIKTEIAAEIARTAELLDIGGLLDRKPGQLSGGQRQRVALGRAIVRHPQAFLLDEPLSNLDAGLRVQTRKEIVELHRRVGASTVYVTHDQTEAMTMSDRVAVMMAGEILQIAAPRDIYLDPADLRVAAFMGSPRINAFPAEAGTDGQVRVEGAATGVAVTACGALTFAARPEDLAVDARDGIAARVEHVEFLGEALLLHARTELGGESAIARLDGREARGFARGQAIRLRPDPARALLFDGAGKRLRAASRARSLKEAAHG
jgi:multiple sugar transport system ATP-binding protein